MALLVIFLCFVGMTWMSAVNPRAALLIVIFLVPWNGLDADIGLRVSAYQVALAPLCLVTLMRAAQPGWAPPRIAAGGLLLAMALHAVIWSLVQIAFIPILDVGDSVFRGPTVRAVVQIILYLFNLSPAILCCLLLRDAADVRESLRIYLVSLVVLACIGWVQVALWYGIGYNPIPVGAVSVALGGTDAHVREGQFIFDQLNIYRMNSLAGEPRQLAVAMVLGMLFIQVIALSTARVNGWRLASLWLFMLAATIATFSTSGAAVWAIGTAATLPILWLTGVRMRRSRTAVIGSLLVVILPLGFGIAAAEAAGIPVIDLISERTIERIEANGAVEDFDLAITDYLQAHPGSIVTGTGLGNAHLYATPYLDPLFALYAEGQVFQAKTSLVRIVSELGLIGLGLFSFWYLSLVWQVRAATVGLIGAAPEMAATAPIALMILLVFMATGQIAGETWVMAGIMAALSRARFPAAMRADGLPA